MRPRLVPGVCQPDLSFFVRSLSFLDSSGLVRFEFPAAPRMAVWIAPGDQVCGWTLVGSTIIRRPFLDGLATLRSSDGSHSVDIWQHLGLLAFDRGQWVMPEVGFWIGGFTPVRKASDRHAVIIEFADHTRGTFAPGDDVLGWTVVDIRRVPATTDLYVLLAPSNGSGVLELWPHILPPPPNAPWQMRHMKWKDWLHHCNQLDAIRYRAEGYIVVVGKPNGEPDDPDPFGPSKAAPHK